MSEKEPYRDCIFSEKGECGPCLPKRAHDLAKFHSLINDTSSAVKFIKINSDESCLEANDILTEKGLIGNRAHLKVLEIPQEAVCMSKTSILLWYLLSTIKKLQLSAT